MFLNFVDNIVLFQKKISLHTSNSHVQRMRKVDQVLYFTLHYICFSNCGVVYQGNDSLFLMWVRLLWIFRRSRKISKNDC